MGRYTSAGSSWWPLVLFERKGRRGARGDRLAGVMLFVWLSGKGDNEFTSKTVSWWC